MFSSYALKHKIPFACIPCCIFKTLFPNRILKSGQKISTYNGLIKYLREKDPRIRLAQLPFVGRNIVLYMCSYVYMCAYVAEHMYAYMHEA